MSSGHLCTNVACDSLSPELDIDTHGKRFLWQVSYPFICTRSTDLLPPFLKEWREYKIKRISWLLSMNELFQGIAKLPFIDVKVLLSATKTVEKDLAARQF